MPGDAAKEFGGLTMWRALRHHGRSPSGSRTREKMMGDEAKIM